MMSTAHGNKENMKYYRQLSELIICNLNKSNLSNFLLRKSEFRIMLNKEASISVNKTR